MDIYNFVKEKVHMKHTAHKRLAHFKKRYKHIAAAFAGAILMSSALLPGIPVASVHASVNPDLGNARETSAQKMKHENREDSLAGQNIKSKKTPRNASKPNVSGSEARQLIRQNLNKSKSLKTPTQLPTSKTLHKPMKPSTNHTSTAAPNPSHSPAKESKTETSVKPSAHNHSSSETIPSSGSDKDKRKQEQAAPDSQKKPKDSAEPKPDQDKNKPGSVPTHYEKVLDISATAYAPGPLDNDQWGDKTYLGTTIRPGVIAVDPKVIPLGSRLYLQYPDGHGEYAVAEDTGGAIKGNRIDIAMMDRGKATEFGIKDVKVYVVKSPNNEE